MDYVWPEVVLLVVVRVVLLVVVSIYIRANDISMSMYYTTYSVAHYILSGTLHTQCGITYIQVVLYFSSQIKE